MVLPFSLLQILICSRTAPRQPEGSLDLSRDHFRIGQVGRVFEAIVFEPEDVQVDFVPIEELLVCEAPEPFRLFAVMPVIRVVTLDEIQEVIVDESLGL